MIDSSKTVAGLLMALAPMASHADNCEPMRAQIEPKFSAGGRTDFLLAVVDAGMPS